MCVCVFHPSCSLCPHHQPYALGWVVCDIVRDLGWLASSRWTSLDSFAALYGTHRVKFLGQNITVAESVARIRRMQTEGAAVVSVDPYATHGHIICNTTETCTMCCRAGSERHARTGGRRLVIGSSFEGRVSAPPRALTRVAVCLSGGRVVATGTCRCRDISTHTISFANSFISNEAGGSSIALPPRTISVAPLYPSCLDASY